jgi:hypothetical protein
MFLDLDSHREKVEEKVEEVTKEATKELSAEEVIVKILESDLDFRGATIKDFLDLSTKEGPTKIYVDSKKAQLVHWAAPTVPLVVI